MVKEQWVRRQAFFLSSQHAKLGLQFADAIKDEPDLFLLAGHMPVQKDNWPLVFNAVRAIHPTTPIIILGGHTHIRDCSEFRC